MKPSLSKSNQFMILQGIAFLLFLIFYNPLFGQGITSVAVTTSEGNGYQFTQTDESFTYFTDPLTPGYSYVWITSEGHVSHVERPIFYFDGPDPVSITILLVPRKKPETNATIVYTSEPQVYTACTGNCSNGTVLNNPIYFAFEAKLHRDVYLIIPLSCPNSNANYTIEHSSTLQDANVLFSDQFINLNYSSPNHTISFNKQSLPFQNDEVAVIRFHVNGPLEDSISCVFSADEMEFSCKPPSSVKSIITAGPYDPNYKQASIGTINTNINTEAVSNATQIEYAIHYQNIGMGYVDSITIQDILPAHLRLIRYSNGAQFLSSHPNHTSYQETNGTHTWIIGNHSNNKARIKGLANPAASIPSTKGWIKFMAEIDPINMLPFESLTDTCYCMCNEATIYFDEEPAFVTELDVISIGDSLCFKNDHVLSRAKGQPYFSRICDTTNLKAVLPPGPPDTSNNNFWHNHWDKIVIGVIFFALILVGFLRRKRRK